MIASVPVKYTTQITIKHNTAWVMWFIMEFIVYVKRCPGPQPLPNAGRFFNASSEVPHVLTSQDLWFMNSSA